MVIGPTQLQSNPQAPNSPSGRAASFPVSPAAPVSRQPGSSTSNAPQAPIADEVAVSSTNGTDSVAISQSAFSAGSSPALTASADQFTPSTGAASQAPQGPAAAETPETAGGFAGSAPANSSVPPVSSSVTSELSRGSNVDLFG